MTNSRPSVIAPEILAGIREHEGMKDVPEEQLNAAAHLFASIIVSVLSLPETGIFASMGQRALLLFVANSFASAFLPVMVRDGIINLEGAKAHVDDIEAEFLAGEGDKDIAKKLWN